MFHNLLFREKSKGKVKMLTEEEVVERVAAVVEKVNRQNY